jgi:membrane-associated phospholipid phosphatase
MKKLLITGLLITAMSVPTHAAEFTVERIGDLLQVVVPAMALGMTLEEDGYEGTWQFAQVFAATTATEGAIKYFVEEHRPNGTNNSAFPSGHTMAAFSGATFIHRRYGLERAALPYVLAGFVGYSRVQSKWHNVDDVVAGAIFAGMYTMIFADRKMPPVTVNADTHGASVNFNVKF